MMLLMYFRKFQHANRTFSHRFCTKLSEFDIDSILKANEYTRDLEKGLPVKYYESNQLPSNSPCEDTKSEGSVASTYGLIFGVFDGHGKYKLSLIASSVCLSC